MINRLLTAPEFTNDQEKNRIAKLIHQIIMASWILPVLAIAVSIVNPPTSRFVLPVGIALTTILIVLMLLNRNGQTIPASYILVGALTIILTYLNYIGAGEPRPLLLLSVVAILVGGLLLGSRGAMISATLLAIQNMVIVILHANGIIAPINQPPTIIQNIVVITVSYLLIGFMFHLAISRIQLIVNQIRESEKNLQASNRDLQGLSASLEQRVAQRTMELQEQQQIALRRSRQFEGITRVSKAINTTKILQEALPQIARAISEQFGYYHVGIFLTDPTHQYAVLSASNSSGGQKMIARKHQLKIGEQGIVGYVTQAGKARIALDVGADAIYFNNPELPLTHSEMALPLKQEDRVIGALDIQSEDINAFSDEDIEALETLADQVSLAIENARLFGQTEKSLAELDAAQRQYLRETWSRLPQDENFAGFRYSAIGATEIDKNEKISLSDNNSYREIVTPITIRGESIGSLSIQVPKHERITTDQMDLIRAVADRVALSAENARLFEETSRRASRERIISDISSKIGTSVRTESILRTAAAELSQLLNNVDIFINLQTAPNEKEDAG